MTYEKICIVVGSFALGYNNSANTRKNPSFFDKLMLTFNDNMLANPNKCKKKRPPKPVVAQSAIFSDRSGEKPYCTFIICIRLHFVNNFFENGFSAIFGFHANDTLLIDEKSGETVASFRRFYKNIFSL
ncbi:hypothetical protein FE783_05605 [Paenibacillus mesophilus]|uniref:hypothetical protein n=1 Tax=Paenibacillus mesophilus TaxID=2582849 RepID=UPI00110D5D3A|nr:hypothetical protein [Paenibacillus mesophilus]TMV51260.1 hypothetical protein FE783_05605 [Paenibacillus mesophilus]